MGGTEGSRGTETGHRTQGIGVMEQEARQKEGGSRERDMVREEESES